MTEENDYEIEQKLEDYRKDLNKELLDMLNAEKEQEKKRDELYNEAEDPDEKNKIEEENDKERDEAKNRINKMNR